MKNKTIFPKTSKEIKKKIDISKYLNKIINKNYNLLKELGKD